MQQFINNKFGNFTSRHRQRIFLSLSLLLLLAIVFATVTAADYEQTTTVLAEDKEFHNCFLAVDGKIRSVKTSSNTVAELLEERGITLDRNDRLNYASDSTITNGMKLEITRVNSYTCIEDVQVPYETIRVEDPELYWGSEVVETEGKNGTITITTQLTFNNDKLVSENELSSEWTVMPIDKIIRYGTKPYNAAFDAKGAHSEPSTFIVDDTPSAEGGGTITLASGESIKYSDVIAVSATAYTTERQSFKLTYTGTIAHVGGIAVDPNVIPLGTKMYIVSADGTWTYGYATAEDIGGGIKTNKIDLFFNTYNECIYFGVRDALVYIID